MWEINLKIIPEVNFIVEVRWCRWWDAKELTLIYSIWKLHLNLVFFTGHWNVSSYRLTPPEVTELSSRLFVNWRFGIGSWSPRGPQLKFTLKSNLIFFTFRPFFSRIYFFYFFSFVSFSSLFLLYFPFFLTFLHLLLLSLIFFPFSHFFIFTSPTGKPLAADDRHWLNHIVRAGVSSMTKLAIKPNH